MFRWNWDMKMGTTIIETGRSSDDDEPRRSISIKQVNRLYFCDLSPSDQILSSFDQQHNFISHHEPILTIFINNFLLFTLKREHFFIYIFK